MIIVTALLWIFGTGYMEYRPMPDIKTCKDKQAPYEEWARVWDRKNVWSICIEVKDNAT